MQCSQYHSYHRPLFLGSKWTQAMITSLAIVAGRLAARMPLSTTYECALLRCIGANHFISHQAYPGSPYKMRSWRYSWILQSRRSKLKSIACNLPELKHGRFQYLSFLTYGADFSFQLKQFRSISDLFRKTFTKHNTCSSCLLDLSDELLLEIASHLPPSCMVNLAQVCRRLLAITKTVSLPRRVALSQVPNRFLIEGLRKNNDFNISQLRSLLQTEHKNGDGVRGICIVQQLVGRGCNRSVVSMASTLADYINDKRVEVRGGFLLCASHVHVFAEMLFCARLARSLSLEALLLYRYLSSRIFWQFKHTCEQAKNMKWKGSLGAVANEFTFRAAWDFYANRWRLGTNNANDDRQLHGYWHKHACGVAKEIHSMLTSNCEPHYERCALTLYSVPISLLSACRKGMLIDVDELKYEDPDEKSLFNRMTTRALQVQAIDNHILELFRDRTKGGQVLRKADMEELGDTIRGVTTTIKNMTEAEILEALWEEFETLELHNWP